MHGLGLATYSYCMQFSVCQHLQVKAMLPICLVYIVDRAGEQVAMPTSKLSLAAVYQPKDHSITMILDTRFLIIPLKIRIVYCLKMNFDWEQ